MSRNLDLAESDSGGGGYGVSTMSRKPEPVLKPIPESLLETDRSALASPELWADPVLRPVLKPMLEIDGSPLTSASRPSDGGQINPDLA